MAAIQGSESNTIFALINRVCNRVNINDLFIYIYLKKIYNVIETNLII